MVSDIGSNICVTYHYCIFNIISLIICPCPPAFFDHLERAWSVRGAMSGFMYIKIGQDEQGNSKESHHLRNLSTLRATDTTFFINEYKITIPNT